MTTLESKMIQNEKVVIYKFYISKVLFDLLPEIRKTMIDLSAINEFDKIWERLKCYSAASPEFRFDPEYLKWKYKYIEPNPNQAV
jgi:hypothetical protein